MLATTGDQARKSAQCGAARVPAECGTMAAVVRTLAAMKPITDLSILERHLLSGIPLAREMQMRVAEYDGQCLVLVAPLAPNVNDKGCAFGGSLVSLMTLACWGLATLRLGEAGHTAEVFVQDSMVNYLEPVWGEIVVEARQLIGDSEWDEFIAMFTARGKARITLTAEVTTAGGGIAARLSARFVALRGESASLPRPTDQEAYGA